MAPSKEGAFFIGSLVAHGSGGPQLAPRARGRRGSRHLTVRGGWGLIAGMTTPRAAIPLLASTLLLGACVGFATGSGQGTGSGSASASGGGGGGGGLLGAIEGVACPELTGRGSALGAKFTADARLNVKVASFVQASKDLVAVSMAVESEVAEACRKMGADLGVDANSMGRVDGPGGAAKGACAALSAKIDAALSGGIKVEAHYTPPQCTVNASAKAACEGHCKVEADPGEIVAHCEPAKLSGRCEGTCSGRCEGTCKGQCAGECSAKDAQGRCVGSCSGECKGSCSGTCHARCEGSWKAPRCEGHVTPPSVDADCKASCSTRAEITSQCTKPSLTLKASQSTALVGKLLATATVHVPALLVAEFKLGRQAAKDIQVLVRLGRELEGKLQGAGNKAIACVGAAATAVAEASVSINVSVQASASVSGKVGAGI